MRRAEIERKFDEIVEFAEVERFIDTPVKRYSSGMQLRLAFSVAAHLEPEILIIDEVLSVGDLAFQEKCLGRMEERGRGGPDRAVREPQPDGGVEPLPALDAAVVGPQGDRGRDARGDRRAYVRSVLRDTGTDLTERSDRVGQRAAALHRGGVRVRRRVVDSPATGQDFDMVLRYETSDGKPLRNISFAVQVMTLLGDVMLHLYTGTAGVALDTRPRRVGEVRCSVPRCPLPPGQYTITLWADRAASRSTGSSGACELTVREGDFFGSGQAQLRATRSVLVDHGWTVAPRAATQPRRAARPEGRSHEGAASAFGGAFDLFSSVLRRLRRSADRSSRGRQTRQSASIAERHLSPTFPSAASELDSPMPLALDGLRIDVVGGPAALHRPARETVERELTARRVRRLPRGVARHGPDDSGDDHWYYLSSKGYLFANASHFTDAAFVQRFVRPHVPAGGRVLDFGAGAGGLDTASSGRGVDVWVQ